MIVLGIVCVLYNKLAANEKTYTYRLVNQITLCDNLVN